MTEARPERPLLATIICIWEVLVALGAVAADLALRLRHRAYTSHHPAPPPSPHLWISILSYALAVAAAITLWQMRRSAFVLLAARFVLDLVWEGFNLLRPVSSGPTRHLAARIILLTISCLILALNALIAWYAFRITWQKPRHPNVYT